MEKMIDDHEIREHWEDVARHWREHRPERLWRRHADAVNLGLVDRWLPSRTVDRLLKTDLFDEAANGGLHPMLSTRARLVVGMDLSAGTVRSARSRAPGLEVVAADARSLPFADGSFDVIVSNSTLDHFRTRAELVASLAELGRVLRPGGELLLTLDNLANPVVAFRNAVPFHWLKRLRIMPYYVGASLGPRRLRRLLEDTGWEIREMDAILHCPRFLSIHTSLFLQRRASLETQQRFLAWLSRFEGLARWPTRFVTGYFVAARAVRKA